MRALAILMSFIVAVPAASAGTPQPAGVDQDRAIVARAEGGWTITREIREEPASLALATDGLLLADDDASADAPSEGERRRREELDERLDRAFEEAADLARAAQPRGRQR